MYNRNGIEEVIDTLMCREDISREDALQWVKEALEWVEIAIRRGEDPDDIWMDQTGLEPDYLYNIMMQGISVMKITYYSVEWVGNVDQKTSDAIIFNTKSLTKALKRFRDEVKNQQTIQRPKTEDVSLVLVMNEVTTKGIKRSFLMSSLNQNYWIIEL